MSYWDCKILLTYPPQEGQPHLSGQFFIADEMAFKEGGAIDVLM